MTAYLEHFPDQGGPAERLKISKDPFRIGRSSNADLTLCSHRISKNHAAITQSPQGYVLTDLSSTNGTFVNGKRVDRAHLCDGDIIHVAHWELGFGMSDPSEGEAQSRTLGTVTHRTQFVQRESLIRQGSFLQQLVSNESVSILFQPIVDLETGACIGYEALGRGTHHRLHQSPMKLFELAEKCRLEHDLCRLFRKHAMKIGSELPPRLRLFLNIHPAEFAHPDFLDSLEELARWNHGRRQLVVEISEQSITNVSQLHLIRRRLIELGIEFAYDDFGAGQARLLEVAECPPHFLKLDRSLVQGMETSESSRGLVKVFISALAPTGTQIIAEGIETSETAELCRESGCHLGQGFYFGQPVSLAEIFLTLEASRLERI